ncbi:hypothetical protein Tco_1062802 [Tanacetum coccineum]
MEDHDTSGDAGASTARKYLVVLQDLLDSNTLATEVGVTAAVTVPFVTSSVTPTPERESDGRTNSISGPNLQTRHPAKSLVGPCMTRSSTKELLSPFENPEQNFHSKRRLFDTPSLVESNSSEFDHNFDIEEQLEKEELHDNTFNGSEHEDVNEHIEKVLEIIDLFYILKVTQDQIMLRAFHVSLTGAASRWLRNQPSGSVTTWEEDILFYNGLDVLTRQILDSKGAIPSKTAADAKIAIQEMAEYSQKWHNGTSLRTRSTETSDGLAAIQAQLNNLGLEIKKDYPQKEKGKTLEEAYYTQFGVLYQPGGQYRAAGPGFYQRNNGNSSYPDRRPSLEESLAKFMTESAKRHEENSNIIKEIRASTDVAIRNQGALIKTLEIQIGQMSKVLQKRRFGSLPSSTGTNPRDQLKLISTAKANFSRIRRIGCGPYVVLGTQHRSILS